MAPRLRFWTRQPEPAPAALTAAVETYRPQMPASTRADGLQALRPLPAREWQRRGWDFYDQVWLVKKGFNLHADLQSKVRLYVGYVVADGEPPIDVMAEATRTVEPDEDGTPGRPNALTVAEAEQLIYELDRLQSAPGGQSGILRNIDLNLNVPGECSLVAYPLQPDPVTGEERERWEVLSTDELKYANGIHPDGSPRYQRLGPDGRWQDLPAGTFARRIWRPHARRSWDCDSPMRAIIENCATLMTSNRMVRSAMRSRTSAGLLLFPREATAGAPDPTRSQQGGQTEDPTIATLEEAFIDPVGDEGSASAVAPTLVVMDKDLIPIMKDALLTLDRPMNATEMALRKEARGAILEGLPLPPEFVEGFSDVKYANAWYIGDSVREQHIDPDTALICTALTDGIFRDLWRADGIRSDLLARVGIFGDPTALSGVADVTANAEKAHDAYVISDAKYAQVLGFSPADKPDEAEEQHRVERAQLLRARVSEDAPQDVAPGVVNDGTAPAEPARTPLTASAGAPDGVMVAFYPAPAEAEALALDGGERPETIHVTLAYMGKAADLTAAQVEMLHEVVNLQAREWAGPLVGEFGGIGRFSHDGSPDGDPVWAAVDVPGLGSLRDTLARMLAEADLPLPSGHGWTGHATLAYIPPDAEMPILRLDPTPATFAALSVCVGPQRTDYPLTGQVVPLVASATRRPALDALGRRLAGIDRDLAAKVRAAADVELEKVLTRAGNRIYSQMPRSHAQRKGGFPDGADTIAATMGRAYVETELHLTEGELLAKGFDGLRPRFLDWTADAHRRALRALAAASGAEFTPDDVDREVDGSAPNRTAAWDGFLAGLLTLASARLYDPHPAAPPLGEHDTGMRVPTVLVREALARAGGATVLTPTPGGGIVDEDGLPVGGVAQGVDVVGLFRQFGVVTSGWVWEHGDPTRPFDAHEALDGAEFEFWDDPILDVQAGDEWLGVDHYRPGDHEACSCDYYRQLDAASDNEEAA